MSSRLDDDGRQTTNRDVLFGPARYENPRLAPDGRHLAWLRAVDDIAQIWVGDVTDPERTGRAVTAATSPIRFHCWAPDGDGLLHIADPTGAEVWQVLHTDRQGTSTRPLTSADRHADVLARSWSAPHDVLLSIDNEECGLPDVVRHDLRTGRNVVIATNPGTIDAWFVDAVQRVRAATAATADGGFDLLHRADDSTAWTTVLHVGGHQALTSIVVSLPTVHEVALVTALDADTTQLVVLDVRTGERRWLGGDGADIDRVLVHPISGMPQAYSVNADRHRWHVIDPAVEADLDALTQRTDVDLRIVDRDRDDRRWLVAHDAPDQPSTYSIWDRPQRRLTPVLDDRPALRQLGLAAVRPIAFDAPDGMRLHGYWTAPARPGPGPAPTVILVHGGPWWRDLWEFDPWVQWLAALGHGVLQVNFRGSAGRGISLINAGDRQWGAAMVDDLVAGLDHAIAAGWSDPQRIVAMGSSYGGYAALMLATTGRVASVVAHAAPTDLVAFLDSIPADHPTMRQLWTTRVGDVDDPAERQRLYDQSPLSRVGAIRCPVLLAHGVHDTRVPTNHSHQLAEALAEQATAVRQVLFDDEGHEIVHPANLLRFADEVAAHLQRSSMGVTS